VTINDCIVRLTKNSFSDQTVPFA